MSKWQTTERWWEFRFTSDNWIAVSPLDAALGVERLSLVAMSDSEPKWKPSWPDGIERWQRTEGYVPAVSR